jgi:hypothetical protein
MGDDDLRREYSDRAKRYVTDHISWEITARKHEKVYRKVVMEKKDGPSSLREQALLDPEPS